MKKLFVNRKPIDGPTGGGNLFLKALYSFSEDFGYKIVDKPQESDFIFVMDPRPDGQDVESFIENLTKYNKPIIHRVNEIDSKRSRSINIDPLLRRTSEISQKTKGLSIFVSKWLQEEHQKLGWHCSNVSVFYNGIDLSLFKDYNNKLNNGKINICIAHWSADPGKGTELHSFLDDFVGKYYKDYSFTYIGRPNFVHKNSNIIPPLYGKELAIETSKYDICINGSMNDPASNSILEAISCGLPTYAPEFGGGSKELVGEDHIWKTLTDVEQLLLNKKFQKNENGIRLRSWEECIKEFFEIIEEKVKV